jgi:Fe-S cluster assembly iron-binding protein IscA
VLERLRAELAQGGGDYLEAVVKETLRLRPVIMSVGRVVRGKPFELGGYLIPPGVEINPSIATIHRREDRYPNARSFRPERFLGSDPPDTYTWLPFGGGTRRCLGASFATFEMQVVIRRVLERTNLETVGRRPEKGVRRGITYVPAQGVRVRLAASPAGASAHSAIGVGTPTLSRASLPCPPNSVDPKWKEASMLTLSPSAVDAVDSLLHGPEVPDDAGLRICTSGESQLTLEIAPEPAPGDQVIEEGGARVFVDSEAAPMLDTAELDARTEGDQVAFDLTPTGGNNSSVTGE